MKASKNTLIFVFTFLIVIRVFIEETTHSLLIVAMINIVALLIVLFQIADSLKVKILDIINIKCLSKEIAKREAKKFTVRFNAGIVVFAATLTALYLCFWCSNLGNDIISIIALACSLFDEEIISLGLFLYRV